MTAPELAVAANELLTNRGYLIPYKRSMTRAELILREKITDEQGNLQEMVIWKVTPNPGQPQGVRYRLAFIRAGAKEPAILYDNHHPKGHHRHFEGIEETYEFTDVGRLVADFMADVRRLVGGSE